MELVNYPEAEEHFNKQKEEMAQKFAESKKQLSSMEISES